MASVTITTIRPSKTQEQLFSAGFNMVYNDGVSDVINKDYTVSYNEVHGKAADLVDDIIKRMKADIDDYLEEEALFISTGKNNALTSVQNAINTHIEV